MPDTADRFAPRSRRDRGAAPTRAHWRNYWAPSPPRSSTGTPPSSCSALTADPRPPPDRVRQRRRTQERAPPASEQISAARPPDGPIRAVQRRMPTPPMDQIARGWPRFPCSDVRCRRAQTGTDIGTSAAQAHGGRRRRACPPATRLGAAGDGTASEPFASEPSDGLATGSSAAPVPGRHRFREQRPHRSADRPGDSVYLSWRHHAPEHGTAIQNYGARKARGPPLRK